jgi:4-hydroxythreonine-4-phosphate dehydrogenase
MTNESNLFRHTPHPVTCSTHAKPQLNGNELQSLPPSLTNHQSKILPLHHNQNIMLKQQTKNKKIKVGITHGDINGISYEVIIKALNDNRILEMFTPVIYGLSKVLAYNRKNLNFHDFNFKMIREANQALNQKVNLVNLSAEEVRIEYGKSTELAGKLAFDALEKAVRDLKENQIQVMVTAPLNKANIQSDRFQFPGHTEYLTEKFQGVDSLMLMVKDKLRIGTLTTHVPLREVPNLITDEKLMSKLQILNQSLMRDFLIEKPKIAVLGLNPHAGERGLLGDEENKVIQPAIIKAKKNGMLVYGPFPADGFFGSDEYLKYDGILAMYHDQGLVAFKTLAFEGGVNYTAGLSFVRTSPAHGTAYDIAGKNVSSGIPMREAMYLAIEIHHNRIAFDEMKSDPLQSGLLNDFNNNRNHRETEEINRV